jgi:hypothetical protein
MGAAMLYFCVLILVHATLGFAGPSHLGTVEGIRSIAPVPPAASRHLSL